MGERAQSKNRSLILIIVGAILVALVLSVGLWLLLNATRGDMHRVGPATAVLNVIEVPYATMTPIIPTQASDVTPSSDVPPSPPPGDISLGISVQITGTGGDGLRLRSSPGLDGKVLYLGFEGEVFQVLEGPQEADGYTWWYLSAPYDEKVQGWAVSNFISVLQIP